MGAIGFLATFSVAQGQEPTQCSYEFEQCKTDIDPGQSKENDEHCGRMLRFCQETGTPIPLAYSELGLRIIDRAIRLFATESHMPVKEFKANYATALVELPDMFCVGMFPFMATGGNTTICFDKLGERKVLEYNGR